MIGSRSRRRAASHVAPAAAAPAARAALAVILCFTVLGRPASATGEEPAPQGPIERIEVRESAEPVDAALDSTAFATVIRAEDFADRVATLDELLRESAGVQVSSLGGAFATVSIRGSTAEQVVVYLDGVPLNRALGGGVNLADLPLAQIESIEVYRGFTPASLSSASIGGAIVINTRGGTGLGGGSASATIGSFGSAETTVSYAEQGDRHGYSIGIDASTSDGAFTFTDTDGSQSTTGDDRQARRENNDFDRLHLNGRYDADVGTRTHLSISTDLLSRSNGVAGLSNLQWEDARYETSRTLIRPQFETVGLFGGLLLVRGAVEHTQVREEFRKDSIVAGSPQHTDNLITTFGQEFGATLVASAHQAISFLAAHRNEIADLQNRLDTPSDVGRATRDTTAFVLEDQISLGGGRLVVNPSVRHERYDGAFEPGRANGVIPDQPPGADARTTGKIGLRYEVNDIFIVKANFGSFLRLPDFLELFGNRGAVLGNPLLLPETGRNFDAGFVAVGRNPGGVVRHARIEMTYFETRAGNLIQIEPTGQYRVVARNTGRARIRGIELGMALMIGPRFTASFNATRQDAVSTGEDIYYGKLLVGRARDEISTRMELALGRWTLYHAFTYVAANFTDRQNTASKVLPARYLHGLGAHVRLGRSLSAGVEIRNVLDQETFDVARFPLPGRRFAGRLIWTF